MDLQALLDLLEVMRAEIDAARVRLDGTDGRDEYFAGKLAAYSHIWELVMKASCESDERLDRELQSED